MSANTSANAAKPYTGEDYEFPPQIEAVDLDAMGDYVDAAHEL